MNIVIAGGGYAGLFAAARLRKFPGMKVTLVDAQDHFVERVRLHEYVSGGQLKKLPFRELLKNSGIEFIHSRITRIQPDQNLLTLDGMNGARILAYDYLLYGLGSRTRKWSEIPGLAAHAHTLDAGPDLDATRRILAGLPESSTILILGGGLTGLESATEIKESYPHLDVTMIDGGRGFADYTPGAEQEIRKVLKKLQVHVREQSRIRSLDAAQLELADGSRLPFALAINCLGMEVSPLARESGLRTALSGQIQVDEYLRSFSHPNILAIGDAAELTPQYCAAQRMSCAAACPMGTFAAETLRRLQKKQNLLPFRFGYTGRCLSLGRKAALVQMVEPDDSPRPRFFRGRLAVWIKELICLAVVKIPLWELRWALALYRWYQPEDRYLRQRQLPKQGKSA